MKKQTVQSFLKNKVNHWLKSLPEQLSKQVSSHVIVAGGCIPALLLDEQVNDFDVYLDDAQAAKALVEHYIRVHKLGGFAKTGVGRRSKKFYLEVTDDLHYVENYQQVSNYGAISISKNAITLSNDIQIVVKHIGTPEYITSFFDFVHVTSFYVHGTESLVLKPEATESTLARTLIYQGGKYPVASLFRMRKFLQRGWDISPGEITKIAAHISQLDLSDPRVLEDQLVGLNLKFFKKVIEACKTQPLFKALCSLSDCDDISPAKYLAKKNDGASNFQSAGYYRPTSKADNSYNKKNKPQKSSGSYYREKE